MNRNGLIALQVIGGLSILPYPFVLVANIMSMAAPGRTPTTTLFWALMCLYPFVWIALYVMSWVAMKRGAVTLAFGMSSIPALVCLLLVGVLAFSWVGYGLGTAGIGPGGLHTTKLVPDNNAVLDAVILAGQDIQVLPEGEAVDRALQMINAHPDLVNVSIYPKGSPLNAAVSGLVITMDGTITGNPQRKEQRLRIVRALVAHGAHLSKSESTDLRQTWNLKRALYDGPVTTAAENPLAWRIVTHQTGPAFTLSKNETTLLNTPTTLHGTPLYAALLDDARAIYPVLIKNGARLSADEERDPAAHETLQIILESHPDLRTALPIEVRACRYN